MTGDRPDSVVKKATAQKRRQKEPDCSTAGACLQWGVSAVNRRAQPAPQCPAPSRKHLGTPDKPAAAPQRSAEADTPTQPQPQPTRSQLA